MRALTLAVILAGCGGHTTVVPPPTSALAVYGTAYTYQSVDDGLRLRVLSLDALTETEFHQIYDQAYRETETCTSTLAVGPLVVIVPDHALGTDPRGQPRVAYTYFEENIVLIEVSWQRHVELIKHEFVHHLLDAAGVDRTDNACHRSPLFNVCAGYADVSSC